MVSQNMLEVKIEYTVKSFLDQIKGQNIQVVSHFDTDGISSAAIIVQTLKRLDQQFSLKIVKSLTKEFIHSLDPEKITLFVDLASGSIGHIKDAKIKKVYIIDHHEIDSELPENIEMINPQLLEKQRISSSGLAYLFSTAIDKKNSDLAKLGILGMIGDQMEKDIDTLNHGILEQGEIKRKRGLLIYPSTKPINRVLEYSSDPFIPGVTGDMSGVIDLLREANINPEGGKYKSLIELTEEEMEKLVTAVVLREPKKRNKDLIGDLFLIKLFGKLEDAREISAKINACSRNGNSEVAIGLCLEDTNSKKIAESIHLKYKQSLINGIKYIEETEKIEGDGYVIINAKDKIKDTMIGTVTSILSNSSLYREGTIIISLAEDKENNMIKISARNVGRTGRNIRETLANIMQNFEGEVGGHKYAAGCSIKKEDIQKFIDTIKKEFEVPLIKVQKNSNQDKA